MAIKWVGIVKDIKEFQTDEVTSKMQKIEMPNSLIEMQIKGLPFMMPSLIIIFC